METEASVVDETESKPRPELLIIGVPLVIFVFTTAAIQAAAGNYKFYYPLILTPGILGEYVEVPRMTFTLLAGIVLCVMAYQRRSHSLAAYATLGTAAMAFGEVLLQWVTPPGDLLDARIVTTILVAYTPQTIAAVALAIHALIEVAPVEGDTNESSP